MNRQIICVCVRVRACVRAMVPNVAELRGSPAEDGPPPAPPAPLTEAGPVLPVQRRGPHLAHVHLCPPGPLDGLRVVLHRTQRDRK